MMFIKFRTLTIAGVFALCASGAFATQPQTDAAEQQDTAQLNQQQLSNPGAATAGSNSMPGNGMNSSSGSMNMGTPTFGSEMGSNSGGASDEDNEHHYRESSSQGQKEKHPNGGVSAGDNGGAYNNPNHSNPQ
jgi:hypothetical protein